MKSKKTVKKAAKKAAKKAVKKSAPKKVVKKAAKKVVKKAAKKAAPKKVSKKNIKKNAKKISNVTKKVVTTTTTTINPKETHYLLILDESGSMGNVTKETLGGLNEQLQAIKELGKTYPDQEYFVNIVKFNSHTTPLIENMPIDKVKELTSDDYKPNSMTALYDAVGYGVNKLKESIGEKIKDGSASAFVVILTDGEENTSTKYNSESIKTLITDLEKTGMWTFSFIGANQDAILAARSIGVSNSVGYTSSAGGTSLAFGSLSSAMGKRAKYIDNKLYAATTDGLLNQVTNFSANIGENATLLDLTGDVSDEDLKKAADLLNQKKK